MVSGRAGTAYTTVTLTFGKGSHAFRMPVGYKGSIELMCFTQLGSIAAVRRAADVDTEARRVRP